MEVERLNRAGIAERGRNLRRLFRKACRKTLSQARDLEKITAIVGPNRIRMDPHAGDQILGVRRENHFADALLAAGCCQPQSRLFRGWMLARRRTHTPRAPAISAFALRLVSATRFPARSNESKVPASVHQPSKCA